VGVREAILRQQSTVPSLIAAIDALFLAVKAEAETQEVDHDCRKLNCTKEPQRTIRRLLA
jgi:ABC-type cobalamin transport system ATPase subunit